MLQRILNTAGRVRWQALEEVAQVLLQIEPVQFDCPDNTHRSGSALAASARAREQPFDRSNAVGRIRFSMLLLSIGRSPSSMQRTGAAHPPRL